MEHYKFYQCERPAHNKFRSPIIIILIKYLRLFQIYNGGVVYATLMVWRPIK